MKLEVDLEKPDAEYEGEYWNRHCEDKVVLKNVEQGKKGQHKADDWEAEPR